MAINVIKPGLATSVQDAGRHGYYHLGIPPSGALDQYAFRAANLLLGNDETAAALECTLMGPELVFDEETWITVTGAEMVPAINGEPQATHKVLHVPAGAKLTFGRLMAGARAYLAVAGGINVPEVLGSRSTYALGAIGGHEGRKLQAGDQLQQGAYDPAPFKARAGQMLPRSLYAKLEREVELRVMPGLYDHRLSNAARQSFYADTWQVASEADRIGYRYKGGQPLAFIPREQPFGAGADPSNIVDAGYPIGSIQVPAGQEPIILMRDAVSGGGYAMIGTVISADLDLIAQMQPHFKARFVPVNMEQALAARKHYQQRLATLRHALAGLHIS